MNNLFGHCIHRANVDWFEDDFFRLQIQEELHVVGEREQLAFPADIVVAEFDDVFHVVLVRVFQDSLNALGLGRLGFHLKRYTFAFHPDEEVQLKT